MSRHQALQDRLSAIESQLAVPPVRQALPRRPAALRHDAADRVSPVLQQLLAEVLPGALVLDWRQDGAIHAGRMVADGLVYRFRVDAAGVGYRPAWDGIGERGWELRSDSFLQLRAPALRAPAARMDFRRTRAGGGQKRKCSTGYGCGNACISLQKECRIAPRSALGKGRLRRLQQLAAAGDQSAGKAASQVQASRGEAAAALQKARTTQRVQKMLERPEIAEFLRTGKLPAGANSSTEPGTVREMKPGEIAFDPSRFQYKLNATATTGEVGSLSGVRKWDANLSGVMSVWKDPGDGKVYAINGHNRLALANRLGAEAVTVRFLNAATATEARAIGALQNIAEGAGSPMDAAKFFRDTGIKSQADVEARGLPLGSGQASKGLSLSKLPGDVFNAVVRGDLTVNRGAIIGGSGLDDAKQREVFKMIGSRKAITDQTLQELVEHAAASSQRTQTTMSLFGETEEAKDNLITRAKLSASLKAKIAREKRLFSTVSKAKAATSLTEKGGNVINQEQSAKVAGEASEALGVFERLKSSAGPISSALNRAADRVEAGEAESTVRKELERDVFEAVQAELEAVGLRKRPRADSLQERIDAIKRKCSTGYGCGSACISLRKECRTSPGSAIGKQRLKRLLELAAGGASSQRGIAPVRGKEAGALAEGIAARRGQQAAQLRGTRAQQKPAKEQTLEQEISRLQKLQTAHEESANRSGHHPGSVAREVIAGLQALNNTSDYGSKKPGKPLRWNIYGKNHEIPESKLQGLSPRQVSALIYTKVTGKKPGRGQAFGNWFVVPTAGGTSSTAPAEANLAAKSKMPAPPSKGKSGVKVDIQRAKPGGEYGPDGHWYAGGAWMSQGKFVGGKQQTTGSGEQPASATGTEGSGASQRVIRNKEKPRREQPIEPKGKGLDQPVGLKKTAAKNDEDFFNDKGFVLYPRPKGAAGLNGMLFDAAVIQRMSREELDWATDQILTMGKVKRSELTVVDDLENAATRFGSEKDYLNYQRGFVRNQLIGVDDERLKAGLIFMEASRNLGHTSPAQQRLRARRKTTENPPERKGEQGDWVWGLNNVFRAVQLRRDRMAAPSVLTNPGREDPGLAPKAKEQGINAQDVTTSKQQAAFARQQQQAAQAAGDQRGAQAWRKEERTVERNRLATAMNSNKQSQGSLFGVTEQDESMPLFKGQPPSTPSTSGSLAVQSAGGAAARPTAAPASKPGSIAGALRQSMEAMKAADIRQMGMIAEQLFEAGWTIDRRTRYRGMSKDQARDKFKAEFAQKMQAQASSPEAAARATAMRNRAGASGTVSGALKSVLEDMKAQDQRLNDLQRQTIELRKQAEEQFGGQGGEDPSLGGGRPRRRLGGGRRRDAAVDILEARIDALRIQCATMSR